MIAEWGERSPLLYDAADIEVRIEPSEGRRAHLHIHATPDVRACTGRFDMVTLALDTSHAVGSVALARDGVVLGEIASTAPSSHLVELARAVERLLGEQRTDRA